MVKVGDVGVNVLTSAVTTLIIIFLLIPLLKIPVPAVREIETIETKKYYYPYALPPLGAVALELTVEHLTTYLYKIAGPSYSPLPDPLPLQKPALPQITWTDTPTFNEFTKSCVVRVFGIIEPINWAAGIDYYAEVYVDGVSQGVQQMLVGSSYDYKYWGDYDPHVPHLVEVYLWASGTMQQQTGYDRYWAVSLQIGTYSGESVTVWEKPMLFPSYFAFSTDGIYDTDHIYVDGVRVNDYSLWWSGSKLMFRGTNFSLDAELIYQRVFIADAVIDPTKENIVIESPHPYPPSYDNTWTITRTGAERIRVHFTKVEVNDDLYLNNEDGDTIHNYFKYDITDIWSPWVFGDTVKLRLVSSEWGGGQYGFRIDKIEWVGG